MEREMDDEFSNLMANQRDLTIEEADKLTGQLIKDIESIQKIGYMFDACAGAYFEDGLGWRRGSSCGVCSIGAYVLNNQPKKITVRSHHYPYSADVAATAMSLKLPVPAIATVYQETQDIYEEIVSSGTHNTIETIQAYASHYGHVRRAAIRRHHNAQKVAIDVIKYLANKKRLFVEDQKCAMQQEDIAPVKKKVM